MRLARILARAAARVGSPGLARPGSTHETAVAVEAISIHASFVARICVCARSLRAADGLIVAFAKNARAVLYAMHAGGRVANPVATVTSIENLA